MKKESIEKTKKDILEALGKDPINSVEEAIKFLEDKDGLETQEVSIKWVVTEPLSFGEDWRKAEDVFDFSTDEDLIEWTREQRDNIEEAEND